VIDMEQTLESDSVGKWLGVTLESAEPVQLSMMIGEQHTNFYGTTHGGVVFSLADVAMSLAANAEVRAVAIDAHIVFQAASRPGDRLRVAVEQMSTSRRLGSYRATVDGPDGQIASFTGTCYRPPS
jgi:acyl-CoA thioesterase